MSITRPDRRVVTFYSFKGGVGRTMALANIAFRLADVHALNVIAVDWDLEAPGLHDFFGVTAETMAGARGLLDYFHEWQAAAARGDARPPDVTDWLLHIKEGPGVPRYGSISLLVAGRMDGAYGDRLAALDWKEFYAARGGALAVETLRKQLVGRADIVLVDSRTGFTDAGGICTVQIPDGVVLMTAPNKQSLAGVERVAETIARSRPEERGGRENMRVWLSVCRVPSEETHRADAWFEERAPRFEEMIRRGMLLREDHPNGLRSYEIPQHARWGFEEALVTTDTGPGARDQLWLAYEILTVALLKWSAGPFEVSVPAQAGAAPTLEELRESINEAEKRRDVVGLLIAYVKLGDRLLAEERYDEAVDALGRAATIAVGADLLDYHAVIRSLLGIALAGRGRRDEAVLAESEALEMARSTGNDHLQGIVLLNFSFLKEDLADYDGARHLRTEAIEKMRLSGDDRSLAAALKFSANLHEKVTLRHRLTRVREDLEAQLRVNLAASRLRGDREREEEKLTKLIQLSAEGPPLPDEPALRARLVELQSRTAPAASPPSSKPKHPPQRKRRG